MPTPPTCSSAFRCRPASPRTLRRAWSTRAPANARVVAARCFESLEFVAAWGDERQPIRQKLKSNLAQWLRLAPEAVKGAFAAQALKAWRFEAVAAVRKLRYQPSAPERPAELDFSVAGDLTPAKLNALLTELQGSLAWGAL